MAEQKRIRRTPEQIAADLDVRIAEQEEHIKALEVKRTAACQEYDAKIAVIQKRIAGLRGKKKSLLSPKKKKPHKSKAEQIKELVRSAQKSGMKLEEIADKLGMELSA
ncbi:hypothetical protein H8S23_00365 [Anaerofilum sp. BX8]|uniref:Uncharacterized protein n=1 Tax=Anaerofilum hominis TaxID=2763016 RepID=A0A923KX30_9FIRM|nr:hypothetical protein [Anaerofilum hominis]MBC5579954.1 hypothetical protein [Anaerofilum hominis]